MLCTPHTLLPPLPNLIPHHRARHTREAAIVADQRAHARDVLELNVGGTLKTSISRKALTKYPHSMLGAMFSGRHTVARDAEGRVFLDRNPDAFAYVLDFLRNGGKPPADLPADPRQRARIEQEFDFLYV